MKTLFQKILISFLCFSPALAFAHGDTPVGEELKDLIKAIYDATGVAIATLCVMFVRLLCLAHYLT